MVYAKNGILLKCSDPSIAQIIIHIDNQEQHHFIIEELDETLIFVEEGSVDRIRALLDVKLKEFVYKNIPQEKDVNMIDADI